MRFTSFRSATVNFPNHLCGSICDSSGRKKWSSLELISSHLTLYSECLHLSGENCSTQSDRSFSMTPAVKSKRCACFSSFFSASVNRNLRCERLRAVLLIVVLLSSQHRGWASFSGLFANYSQSPRIS